MSIIPWVQTRCVLGSCHVKLVYSTVLFASPANTGYTAPDQPTRKFIG
jgi:hypothetical protein